LRGLTQKQKHCQNCSGKGCRLCDFHGISEFDSVEGLISKFLFEKIGGTTAKFTWIGGEDKPSLVLGTGRPFFVKIQNPHNRILKQTSKTLESLKINNLKIVNESPKKPLKFTSSIKIKIATRSEIDTKNLKKLKELEKQPVVVYDASEKRSEKNIFSVKSKKTSNNEFFLFLKSDGGLPIKRFVDGDNVSPGVADILDTTCKCLEFDFLDVHVNDNN
jgi:tRNA pseudouridine synthase 10